LGDAQMTLDEIGQIAISKGSARARREAWDAGCFVLVEQGIKRRVSFGFQGPDKLTADDERALDWVIVSEQ
jgi:hypothetical protein